MDESMKFSFSNMFSVLYVVLFLLIIERRYANTEVPCYVF
jgi:hypothetical protein